jgi:hypothetical protein
MARSSTKAKAELIEVNGLQVYQWEKTCSYCKKRYKTTSRRQRYCSDSCCKKAQIRSAKNKKEYRRTQETQRLLARTHAVSVAVLKQLESLEILEHKCVGCGSTEGLQCHHINLNPFNNTPSNLEWRCTKCHADEHSRIVNYLKEKDMPIESMYEPSTLSILSLVNKNLQECE